jgi:hypothetical protein
MTLHAWIITLRGRIRERLCPDLQVLRYENELLRRALSAQRRALSLAVEQTTADARSLASKWESLFNAQVQLTEAARHRADKAGAQRDELRAKVESLRNALEAALDRIPHQCEGLDYAEADCPACQVKALAEEPTK